MQGSAPSPDRFGLLGLLGVIRMSDPDLTTLALGTDLTGLGLHLNSPENVYKTFASPWAETPLRPEPDFKVCANPSINHEYIGHGQGLCLRCFWATFAFHHGVILELDPCLASGL